jgi:hypothetical protein
MTGFYGLYTEVTGQKPCLARKFNFQYRCFVFGRYWPTTEKAGLRPGLLSSTFSLAISSHDLRLLSRAPIQEIGVFQTIAERRLLRHYDRRSCS